MKDEKYIQEVPAIMREGHCKVCGQRFFKQSVNDNTCPEDADDEEENNKHKEEDGMIVPPPGYPEE
jgi:predicted Zn-ribbon and HTH transcriptional regulator